MSYWAVVYTDAQAEPDVRAALERQGFGAFLPYYLAGAWYRNRFYWTERPLLPRYLFVHLADNADWSSVAHTNGVNRILVDVDAPARIPSSQIAEVMLAHASGDHNVIASRPGAVRRRRRRRRRPRHGKVATGPSAVLSRLAWWLPSG